MDQLRQFAIVLVPFLAIFAAVSRIDAASNPSDVASSADASFDPAKIPKLAVVVVGPGPSRLVQKQSDSERAVEDEFVQVLLRKGYTVSSRSDLEAVIKEQHFQRSGLTESDAAAIGKVLNVPAVMVVRVTELNSERKPLSVTKKNTPSSPTYLGTAGLGVRLIDVERASVLWIGKSRTSRPVNGVGDFSGLLSDVAKRAASSFPSRKPPAKTPSKLGGESGD
jgi:hypothetical protein